MNKIELIKAEIERRIKDCKKANGHFNPPRTRNAICYDELTNLLSFINSLPEDEPSENIGQLKDLEKAAEEYAHKWRKNQDGSESRELFFQPYIRGFKAGAEWQKEHMIKEDEK